MLISVKRKVRSTTELFRKLPYDGIIKQKVYVNTNNKLLAFDVRVFSMISRSLEDIIHV